MAAYKPEVTYHQRRRGLTYDNKEKRYDFEPDSASGIPLPGQNEYAGPAAPSTAGAGRGKMGRDAGEVGKSWDDTFKKK